MPLNYGKSLVALASSVLTHFSAESNHTTLTFFDELLAKKRYKNVVVMLFDGMGTEILKKHQESAPFLTSHLRDTISSVFPPTTTAATTSIQSGLTPLEHAWLGWSTYFKELDKTINLFPNTDFFTDEPIAEYNAAKTIIPYKSIEEKINDGGKYKAYFVSKHASVHIETLEELTEKTVELCQKQGEKYVYTYWNQPDFDIHDLGVGHEKIAWQIRLINDTVEKLCQKLEDTLLVVTADHGLVDVNWVTLQDYPDVLECLVRTPSIESRALTFFVKEGMHDTFKYRFLQRFGDKYLLLSKAEVLQQGIFGSGKPHKKFDDFLGDYLAIATSDLCIEPRPLGEFTFRAMHAGLSDDELNVPFIAVELP